MQLFALSIAMTVGANLLYHISQKSIPATAPPLLSLLVSYTVALVATLFLLPFSSDSVSFTQGLRRLNWSSFAVGLSIVGIELGFLLAYRSGWKLSVGSVAVSVAVALLLIPTGALLFRERLSARDVPGSRCAWATVTVGVRRPTPFKARSSRVVSACGASARIPPIGVHTSTPSVGK